MNSMIGYAMAAMVVAFAAVGWAVDAAAVTPITSCPVTLTTAGETYVLSGYLMSEGTCLTVAADRITIDFRNHFIFGDGSTGAGVTDAGIPRNGILVKNGIIDSFEIGIDLAASTRSTVVNVWVGLNLGDGMVLGSHSLVKTCAGLVNGGRGVVVGDYSQVQDCTALENLGDGIQAGSHTLVTGDYSAKNGGNGFTTGAFSTVTFSSALENAGDGIRTGARSLVNWTNVDHNGDNGIEVDCPGSVTNNISFYGNANATYMIPPGCFANNNN